MGIQILFELPHHTTCQLVQTGTVNTQKEIGMRHLQVFKERRFERGVFLGTSIHQLTGNISTLFTCPLNGTYDGSHLHEVGSCTRHDTYIFPH